jgi:hypothetical protein
VKTSYRIAPEYRRCLIYCLLAIPLWGALAIWLPQPRAQGGLAEQVILVALLSVVGLALLAPLVWRLDIGQRGITRRRLWGCDHWSWADFASGTIEKHDRFTLRAPMRPWWRRRLRLNYLAAADRQQLLDRINVHYRLPPAPQLPESITIRYAWKREATFDAGGIHQLVRGQPRKVLWNEVIRLRITRLEPFRRDFSSLQLYLPDEKLTLRIVSHQAGRSPSWRGPEAEVIAEFLLRYMPPDRVDVDIDGERPSRRQDVTEMLAETRSRKRAFRTWIAVYAALLLAVIVWMAVDQGALKALFHASYVAILFVPVIWSFDQQTRHQIAQLEQWLASFECSRGEPSDAQSPERSTQLPARV